MGHPHRADQSIPRVSWAAHLGGFVGGLVLGLVIRAGVRLRPTAPFWLFDRLVVPAIVIAAAVGGSSCACTPARQRKPSDMSRRFHVCVFCGARDGTTPLYAQRPGRWADGWRARDWASSTAAPGSG